VLVKSAIVMERLAGTTLVAFDKTGTLTEGTPRVAEIYGSPGLADVDVLRLAAGAEQPSEHPLAAAVLAAARDRRVTVPAATDFSSTPGRGVRALVDGHRVEVGSPALLDGRLDDTGARSPTMDSHDGRSGAAVRTAVELAQSSGRTAVVVLVDGLPVGVLALADRIRPSAANCVAALTETTGARPVLLTGDNQGAADRLAAEAGIGDVHAGLLPAGKVDRVRALQGQGHRVLLVGDGVNDAPALAAADLGVAMGGHGSDLALQSADAVLVRDDLATLPAIIALSKRARRLMIANLGVAAAFITVLVTWDLVGHLPLPLGVAGHEGSTVIVGLNGLRLLHSSAWRRASSLR
jgi:cation transport ATPase